MLKEIVHKDELIMMKRLPQNAKLIVNMNKLKKAIFETNVGHYKVIYSMEYCSLPTLKIR